MKHIFKIFALGFVLISLCQTVWGKELEILTSDWFFAPPFSIKCEKAEERLISETYDKKFVDIALLIKNRSSEAYLLSGTETYSFYLQDIEGRIYSSEFFGKKVALYWYDKPLETIDKDIYSQEMVKARITFLTPAKSAPAKLILRSLEYPGEMKEVKFSETTAEAKLFIPQHTLSPLPTQKASAGRLGFTIGGRLSIFISQAGTSDFMPGGSIYNKINDKLLAKIAIEATSYKTSGGKITLLPLSLTINQDFLAMDTLKFYGGLGGAYLIQQSANPLLSEDSASAVILAGMSKEFRENLSANAEIKHFSGQGTSLGVEISIDL